MGGKRWEQDELDALWKLSWEQFHVKFPLRSWHSWAAQRNRAKAPDQANPGVDRAPVLGEAILAALKKGARTLGELADAVDRSPKVVRAALEELEAKGYEVRVEDDGEVVLDRQHRASDLTIDLTQFYGEQLKVAIISCTHFGNKYRQLGALSGLYDICERDKVSVVIHSGDLTDGIGMYKGQEYDQYALGADEQVAATVEEYPRAPVKTLVIGGNHDYSFKRRSGTNVVKRICAERGDLEYCGMLAANFTLGDRVTFRVMHARGGVPYARSYRGQKSNEAMGRGDHVPQVLSIGGMHVVDYVPYLNVHTFLCGCFQGQTPYLQEKGLFPDIGAWIATMNLGDDGRINRCLLEWVSFTEAHEFGDRDGQGVGRGS